MRLSEDSQEFKDLKAQWSEEVKDQTPDTLPDFINKLMTHQHDYGTVCHAIATAAVGAAWAADSTNGGGITGFQAGAVMWVFIKDWMYSSNTCGLKILDFDKFLYPQHEEYFDKVIDSDTWKAIQDKAKDNLLKLYTDRQKYQENLLVYEKKLADFISKYPDYVDDPSKYERLGFATGLEHEARRKAVEGGFEEAPIKPHYPLVAESVLSHWESIVKGVVPFGYEIAEGE